METSTRVNGSKERKMVKECFELEMRLRQVLGLRESGSNYKHLMSELPVYKELVEAKN
jgi:hypothetical protein